MSSQPSDAAPSESGGVDVFVHLPIPLYDRLRTTSVSEGKTLAHVTRTALDQYLPAAVTG